MSAHLRVLGESYTMNTNMTGFRWFQKSLRPCSLDESRLSIGRVNLSNAEANLSEHKDAKKNLNPAILVFIR